MKSFIKKKQKKQNLSGSCLKIEIKEEYYWYIHDCILIWIDSKYIVQEKTTYLMTGYIERILVLLLYSFIDQPTSL